MLDPVIFVVFVGLLSFSDQFAHEFSSVAGAGAGSRGQKKGSKLFFRILHYAAGCIVKLGVRFNRFLFNRSTSLCRSHRFS